MQNRQLRGKVVLITGASTGIGASIAIEIGKYGAVPILIARNREKLKHVQLEFFHRYGVKPPFYSVDVGNRLEVEKAFEKIQAENKNIDILINNAGFGVFEAFADTDLGEIEEMFAVNVFGLMHFTKLILPQMLERNSGHIINIASQAGKIATPKSSGYSASKWAVIGFSNSLRMELKKSNIHVSTVNPGPIKTEFFTIADRSGDYVRNVRKFMLDPDVVAKKIVKLIFHPKRELNMPGWMNISSKLYLLFPAFIEKVAGRLFDKK
ncbi:oxidoreductase [Pueribacillus theae]|uniref:Oxidoreductase n=1 Tax=Pueribacillus theae TaxID=2171751 RepID=A0A2U1K6L3_9BACI|nr:SDR family oxidoreductase [Pueribacillus theae]PWA13181.1 oxidoreductase [Pueribacillus theae]